jgi:hypothetical protein
MQQYAERYRNALTQPYHKSCVRKHAAAVMSGGLGLPEIVRNEQVYHGDSFLSLGRDFIQPFDAGVSAKILMECIRGVWDAIRSGGATEGKATIKRLHKSGEKYRQCLKAIRAEEAVT